MFERLSAASVHVLTATGAGLALLALQAATSHDWQAMFVWLGIAMLIDGIDGPLARACRVTAVLPRWSGERLDLIVDYLTYVAVPAFALSQADLLPQAWRLPAAIAILLSSLFHVADRNSKTEDGFFVGFPAIWNVVALYLFAFTPRPWLALAIVAVLVVLTFVPILCVHPLRAARLRIVTLFITAAWGAGAIGATVNAFPSPLWVRIVLAVSGAYFVSISLWRWRRGA